MKLRNPICEAKTHYVNVRDSLNTVHTTSGSIKALADKLLVGSVPSWNKLQMQVRNATSSSFDREQAETCKDRFVVCNQPPSHQTYPYILV